MERHLKVALVAGEASGDILGAGLMQALREQHPDIEFIGVGGPLMQAQGLQSFFPMERLAVMGLVEVLGRLRELLRRRRELTTYLLQQQPDVFIGIDAPDFNLDLELKLREQGIKTVHYVSPSVWAWRQKRVFKIRQACDLMLCLLPFEAQFYQEHQVPVHFVGHPLADSIALEHDREAARQQLQLSGAGPVVALLPGSRGGEVARLGELFLATARLLHQRDPSLHFVLPAANAMRRAQLETLLENFTDVPVTLLDGQSRLALQACDAVLIASGTATLEAMLFKRPMVVAYRLAWLTYRILKLMVKSRYFALPNLLADEALVPEFIQHAATAENLAGAIEQQLADGSRQTARFLELHQLMRRDASRQAARAVLELL
ncbi:lipid-A-disaccharide synthase [Thiopseudomonas denitrificans]|uniref:Lipid-A-disaccharide synthase n=1 Tax=Thiopseudomonas denitrificans TaxID=1501432 RepID=A0A4R6U512_9GAMM|nr:lipid-A-disaccharide synthase [Thiopseudomonas denitrificans]TDQ39565.1 lipid-A-disaccharide synthase [Thiopseudomonas denitrificans]